MEVTWSVKHTNPQHFYAPVSSLCDFTFKDETLDFGKPSMTCVAFVEQVLLMQI